MGVALREEGARCREEPITPLPRIEVARVKATRGSLVS
ncbi:MAG: hypothetical protein ACI9EF_000689 [Pseudohongiellaceae bacterium]|jgi:hypothetical protein